MVTVITRIRKKPSCARKDELDFKRHVDKRIFVGFILFNVAFEGTLGEFLHRATTRSAGFEAARRRSEKRSRISANYRENGRASKTILHVSRMRATRNINVVVGAARNMMHNRHNRYAK